MTAALPEHKTPVYPEIVERRRERSRERLDGLREKVGSFQELDETVGLCIYVTGSYGREEASEHSDLDLLFVHEGDREEAGLTSLRETLIQADLIRLNREAGFPEFSGDGRYLQTHALGDMVGKLGGSEDDYANLFTARLLLLLESQPVYGDAAYERVVREVIDTYFRDYPDHGESFRPLFLINDILRFWKTLCLNYEHKRNRPADDEDRRMKSHLKNFKLKFSRLTTCFSGVLPLLQQGSSVLNPDAAYDLLKPPPLERLRRLSAERGSIEQLLEDYAWFLERTGRSEDEVLEWFRDPGVRGRAFQRARAYGDTMFQVLRQVVSDDAQSLRYLVI